jgi:hypothetical protein
LTAFLSSGSGPRGGGSAMSPSTILVSIARLKKKSESMFLNVPPLPRDW